MRGGIDHDDPVEVLAFYRRALPELKAEVVRFRKMPERDRAELLFYMAVNLARGMQSLERNKLLMSIQDAELAIADVAGEA